ncbi:hypothetical protein V1503_18865 [Bacillus sp. SCS-151]|uniref:hypothetical protein n=1 Tax=Nanhaiella sioensis TaxID=3115293 RepID=UPI00397B49E3
MSTLQDIFAKPIEIKDIGSLHPIKMIDYDTFIECSNILLLNSNNFDVDKVKEIHDYHEELKLLDIMTLELGREGFLPTMLKLLSRLFSIVLQKKMKFGNGHKGVHFYSKDSTTIINRDNYEEIRKTILQQNLLFEPKVYKDKLVQEWAKMVLDQRAKNSIKMTTEDSITTIAAFSGKHYWDLENYTIYQIKAEFARINKLKNYDTMVAFKCAGDDKSKLNHYAESTDIDKHPQDELFVKNKFVH